MREGKDFGGVGEGHWSFAGRVECVKDVDEKCHQSKMGSAALWDEVYHPRSEERPSHIGEGEEKEAATPEGVNCPNCWPCEYEIYETKAEGCKKGVEVVSSSIDEDGGGIECDNIDCFS